MLWVQRAGVDEPVEQLMDGSGVGYLAGLDHGDHLRAAGRQPEQAQG